MVPSPEGSARSRSSRNWYACVQPARVVAWWKKPIESGPPLRKAKSSARPLTPGAKKSSFHFGNGSGSAARTSRRETSSDGNRTELSVIGRP